MALPEIARRAFNAPLLVDPAKAQAFLVGFGARILGGQIVLPVVDVPQERAERAARVGPRLSIIGGDVAARRRRDGQSLYPVRDGIAIIEATGTMVHRGAWLGNSSGETSYEGLAAQFEAVAADASVRGVAIEIDTFGGQAAGAFDLADLIRSVREVKPVWAFVAESALSAGYIIASQADRIVLPRTGEVGSIGVVAMHVDYSERLAEDGIAVTLIHAGAHKVDGNPFEPLPDPVREEMQAECARLRGIFAETVAAGRGRRMSAEAALATEARVYCGQAAVEAGLADEVSDLRSAFAAFAAKVNGRATTIPFTGAAASGAKQETTMSKETTNPAASAETENPAAANTTEPTIDSTLEEQAESEQEAAAAAPAAPAAAAAGSISRADAAALADIAAQAGRLGVKVDLAAALRDGTAPADLRAHVLETAAKAADAAHVSTAHQPLAAGEKPKAASPIVAAAKKSAEAMRAQRRAQH
jgi:signal peptide peptidase SppA